MDLTQLGWDAGWQAALGAAAAGAGAGRVCEAGPGIYRVAGEAGERLCTVAGRLRHAARAASDLPAVGDWVWLDLGAAGGVAGAGAAGGGAGRAAILGVLPRRTVLVRKAAGRGAAAQVLAANVDVVFVVSSLNQEWNPRRLERYLAVAWESGAQPVVVLSKADLAAEPAAVARLAAELGGGAVPVISVGGLQEASGSPGGGPGLGLDAVRRHLGAGRTAVFVGSSGVGKSTLVNALLGRPAQATAAVRAGDGRGRHTTVARQLWVVPGGGVVIDTPGLRELQPWEADAGLARAFGDVEALAGRCRFADCRHRGEPGCAVAAAVDAGELAPERLASHCKLAAEAAYLAARSDFAALRERKAHAKRMCKAQKRGRPRGF